MKKTTKAFIFLGGASLVVAGLGLAACSSTTTTIVDGGDAAGMDATTGGDGGGSDGGTGSDTGMNDGMAAADCKAATLHGPKADAGPFCPFVGGVAPGANCAIGEYCCKASGLGNGTCVAAGAGGASPCAAMTTAIQCDDDVHCNAGTGGTTCCGTGTIKQDQACVGTTAYFASGFNSTKCSASCSAGDAGSLRMCTDPSECTAPQVCTPFKARGGQFGACQ